MQLEDVFRNRAQAEESTSNKTNLEWNSLIEEASKEAVLPSINDLILKHGRNPPEDIRTVFAVAESLNAERNQHLLTEAAHAAALLNKIDIQPVALKGLAYLITSTYQNPGSRYLHDIDLLIPEEQLNQAADQLLQNHYFQCESATFLKFRHHYPALRREGSPNFELHRQLVLGRANRLLPPKVLLSNAKPLTYNGATFLVPSPTDLVNHLILHSQLAHPYPDRIFPPIRALIDLVQLQSRFGNQIDWHAIAKTYRDNGEFGTLALHLHHAHEVLGLPIPPPIPTTLTFFLRHRQKRRQFLNRHPKLRFLDPLYLLMTLISRRLRLIPLFLKTPSSWPQLLRLLTRRHFYKNLLR